MAKYWTVAKSPTRSKMNALLSLFMFFIGFVYCDPSEQESKVPTEFLRTTEAFFLSINRHVFNDSDFIKNATSIKYRPSLLSMPDLPPWIKFVYNDLNRNGYLYGVPEREEDLTLEVIVTDEEKFLTSQQLLNIVVKERSKIAKYEVQMKFFDINVEDIFEDYYSERLIGVLKKWWRGNDDMYITLIESVVKFGGRRPTNPKEKDGVVVRIGSLNDFSDELKNIEREVSKIANRKPCPREYVKIFADWDFRSEDFIPDWCEFRLLYIGSHG